MLKDTTSENIIGVAWTAEGIDQTFDNIDQHEQAFTEIIHTYGYNDAVRGLGVDNYVIEIGGEVVEFNFADGQLVPVASQWQQGATPMFFYRTLNDGTNDVTVVCDPDGKLYVIENDGYLIKGQNGYAWSVGAAPQALVTNAGGKVTMDAYTDEDETTIISMNGYTVVIDLDGLVTVGEITQSELDKVVEIFADAECTIQPTGEVNKVYAKFYKTVNSSKTFNSSLEVRMQTEENTVYWYDDYIGAGGSTLGEIPAGTIVELNSNTGLNDVTNYCKVYFL